MELEVEVGHALAVIQVDDDVARRLEAPVFVGVDIDLCADGRRLLLEVNGVAIGEVPGDVAAGERLRLEVRSGDGGGAGRREAEPVQLDNVGAADEVSNMVHRAEAGIFVGSADADRAGVVVDEVVDSAAAREDVRATAAGDDVAANATLQMVGNGRADHGDRGCAAADQP